MPAALAVASSPAGDAGAEPQPAAGAKVDSAVTTAAIDQLVGSRGQPTSACAFSSLQNLGAAVALHEPFARSKLGQEAESSNQAAQVGQANCLRFSPTLSSDSVVITDNGKYKCHSIILNAHIYLSASKSRAARGCGSGP